jgi:hypothetical protein
MFTPSQWQSMTIRPSQPSDARHLRNLAQLDSAQPLYGETLMAEVEGKPLAAVELKTGRAIADPFAPTRSLVDLLRVRAAQLR